MTKNNDIWQLEFLPVLPEDKKQCDLIELLNEYIALSFVIPIDLIEGVFSYEMALVHYKKALEFIG